MSRHILLYPFNWRKAVGGRANDFAEMLGGEVHQISVVLDFPRLPIVFYHQVTETVEYVRIAVLCPLSVLIAAVAIQELIAYCELCQQGLMAYSLCLPYDFRFSELVEPGKIKFYQLSSIDDYYNQFVFTAVTDIAEAGKAYLAVVDYGEVSLNAYRGFYLADTSAGVRG